jgi:hypothetical protein
MLPFTKVTETTCVTAHISSEQEKEGTQPMKTQKNNINPTYYPYVLWKTNRNNVPTNYRIKKTFSIIGYLISMLDWLEARSCAGFPPNFVIFSSLVIFLIFEINFLISKNKGDICTNNLITAKPEKVLQHMNTNFWSFNRESCWVASLLCKGIILKKLRYCLLSPNLTFPGLNITFKSLRSRR